MATKTPTKKPKKAAGAKKEKGLTVQQELFCHFYTINDDLRGNATHAYAEAFGYKLDDMSDDDQVWEEYDSETGRGHGKIIEKSTRAKAINACAVQASYLLRNHKIQKRKEEMLNTLLRDDYVDSRLAKWIQDDREPATSIAGIREYNKLKKRIDDSPNTGPITIHIAPSIAAKLGLT